DRIDRQTQLFGIIGSPVSHSLSPRIHNAAFAANEMNAVFIPFEVRELLPFIRRMVHPQTREIDWQLKGLSVTAPHKSMVMQTLNNCVACGWPTISSTILSKQSFCARRATRDARCWAV